MRPREMYIAAPTMQREISEAERRGEPVSTDTITGPIRRAQAYFEQANAVRVLEHAIDTLLYAADQWERGEAERALIDAVALLRERATAIEAEMRQEGQA